MDALPTQWLTIALVGSLLVIVFRRPLAWFATRRIRLWMGSVDERESRDREPGEVIYLLLGGMVAVFSAALLLAKLAM